MNSTIRNILAVIGGIIIGGLVNMGIIMISGSIIPPPGGADVTTTALALVIGAFFLIGGAANVMMLPSPMWFNILDLVGAYLPMAWIGARLASRNE